MEASNTPELHAPALSVIHLSVHYETERGKVIAVEDVSFEVNQGEKLILLGPSGCGKSTLLKTIAGFVPPTTGQMLVNGQPVVGPGPDRVVVFQEFDQLLPWKTVLGNVEYPLRVTGKVPKSEVRARAMEFIRLVRLEKFHDAYPHTLSGGMKQRTAIARSLALEPVILLMDEPFGSLDAQTRNRLQYELNELWTRTGITIVFVTHSIEEAVTLGQRIVVMTPHPGRVKKVLTNEAALAPELAAKRLLELREEIWSLLQGDDAENGVSLNLPPSGTSMVE
ncbi:MAG: ABC transporter ATP-binding protein [Betaproteobacteria bacterium]|nr:ABC transporter ATP-binding protein [Betaproteobacteria bacterium]